MAFAPPKSPGPKIEVIFKRILIANRGEIACRIITTAHRLGIEVVAVYTPVDKNSRHVREADLAVPITDYLDGSSICQAAINTGCEAIHPGYGFLSENPDFVDAITAANIIFIGPSADAIRAMGLKDAAKKLMHNAGIPVVPGYQGADQNPTALAKHASQIGYPVLIKARAGGGGKGMRLAEKPSAFDAALTSAAREGSASFGDSHVIIEKYISAPRHIEVQVFGDGHGNVVHLFERDCSLQRRHQKVIEESPAPNMPKKMRAAMCDAAISAAKAIGYQGAGTIEFIVDSSGGLHPDKFWFMEMNTRLQVEHPVTEAVTGLDLVEWQLMVASGLPLPLKQQDIHLNGHAIEARIYAENPAAGFLPSPGPISQIAFDKALRVDTGVENGDVVSHLYDPMIAKVIAHGDTRGAALSKLLTGLGETHIIGTHSNCGFLTRLLEDKTVQSAGKGFDTGLIERAGERLIEPDIPDAMSFAIASAIFGAAAGQHHDQHTGPSSGQGWRIWGRGSTRCRLLSNNTVRSNNPKPPLMAEHRITFSGDGNKEMQVCDLGQTSPHPHAITIMSERVILVDGRTVNASWLLHGAQLSLTVVGKRTHFTRPDALLEASTEKSDGAVLSPMAGVVRQILVTAGESVEKGQVLLIIEAMKMEHSLTAPRDTVVSRVTCNAGDNVSDGVLLVDFEDQDDA